jgi:hypothetical protein
MALQIDAQGPAFEDFVGSFLRYCSVFAEVRRNMALTSRCEQDEIIGNRFQGEHFHRSHFVWS